MGNGNDGRAVGAGGSLGVGGGGGRSGSAMPEVWPDGAVLAPSFAAAVARRDQLRRASSAMRASMPLTKRWLSSVEYRLASSTASEITAPVGTSDSISS